MLAISGLSSFDRQSEGHGLETTCFVIARNVCGLNVLTRKNVQKLQNQLQKNPKNNSFFFSLLGQEKYTIVLFTLIKNGYIFFNLCKYSLFQVRNVHPQN